MNIFSFDEMPVRVGGSPLCPLFVAADVCRVLEIGNPSDAVRRLEEDERTLVTIEGASNGLPVNAVTESGLYSLIFTSRKPEAKAFRKWVTAEVLPAIRRTGNYGRRALGTEGEEEVAAMIRAVREAFDERRSGKLDNGTASVLANLAKQYCQLWDVRLRLGALGAPALPAASPA